MFSISTKFWAKAATEKLSSPPARTTASDLDFFILTPLIYGSYGLTSLFVATYWEYLQEAGSTSPFKGGIQFLECR
jgi:hypothetical protein